MDTGLNARLDKVTQLLQSEEFLTGKGLSNEVNIRVFCYRPEEEMAVRSYVEKLRAEGPGGCNLKIYNLYQVFLSLCDDKKVTDKAAGLEKKRGSASVLQSLAKFANNKAFVSKMNYEPHCAGDVILLTGVGEVFPFLRVHALLEAMQEVFSDVPIIVFYPGEYNGRELRLFGRLTPNAYYRAFNVI